jgi:hypothetical protein
VVGIAKYFEMDGYGRKLNRVLFALRGNELPNPFEGADWRPDPSFDRGTEIQERLGGAFQIRTPARGLVFKLDSIGICPLIGAHKKGRVGDRTTRSAHCGRGLRVKGGCGRSADSAAGVPQASEITPPFRDLRFVPVPDLGPLQ